MINTNYHLDMDDNNIIQLIYTASEIVTEVPYDTAIQIMSQQLSYLIAFDNNQHNVTFGQSEPWPADEQRIVNIHHRMKTIKYLVICVLILTTLFGYIYLAPPLNTEGIPAHDALMSLGLYDNQQDLIMKEEDDCFCDNVIGKNNLDVIINNGIIDSTTYNEIVDNSTCTLYDAFLYVFNKLCCLKDNIIAIIPTDLDEGASKIKQNGVVMSPIKSSEEFVEK